jgi:hypothetical protein
MDLGASPYAGYFTATSTTGTSTFAGGIQAPSITMSGTILNNSATLGSELLDNTGWTSTNWTGNYDTGFTHTTGNTSVLSKTISGVVVSNYYQLSFTISGMTAGSIDASIGGVSVSRYAGEIASNATYTRTPKAINTNGVIFTPSTDFNGTISSISIKKITAANTPFVSVEDYTGNRISEFRFLELPIPSGNGIFIGIDAGKYITTGGANIGIGDNALASQTSGGSNVALGYSSLSNLTIGSFNTALGTNVMPSAVASYNNTGVGYHALFSTTNSQDNTAVGTQSSNNLTTGIWNTTIGSGSGSGINTGGSNVMVGYNAGSNVTSGAANIIIGTNTTAPSASANYQINIGNTIYGFTSGGGSKIGIGTTSPMSRLSIFQSSNTVAGGISLSSLASSTRSIFMDDSTILHFTGGGNDATLNSSGAWTNASDISYKENIIDLGTKYGLDTVVSTTPRYYNMKGNNTPQVGFIAQELKPIIPEVVEGQEGSMGISYGNLVAVSFQAIKELNEEIKELRAQIKELQIKNNIPITSYTPTPEPLATTTPETSTTTEPVIAPETSTTTPQ